MNKGLKALAILASIMALISCSSVGPVYEFYAHKHTVPNFAADVIDIPAKSPQSQITYHADYDQAAHQAIDVIEQHRHRIHSPGISASVAIDGKLVWSGTSGWADIATDKPLTTQSQFRIGSTSKAVTATLLAKMVEAGTLSLDTPLSTFKLSQLNRGWRDITPRHLASHTAGLPHYKDNSDWSGLLKTMTLNTRYDDVADAVLLFDGSDTLFDAGDDFSYSSLGTVLLSAVMQEAGNAPFQQLMLDKVFEPLKMNQTMPEPTAEQKADHAPDLVSFYWHPDYDEDKVAVWRNVDLSHRLAGGGFISTSTDLARLGLGFMSDEFLSADIRDKFWTPQTVNNGEVNEQNYALGWRVRESDFGDDVGILFQANHGGVSRGAQSWLMVLPQYKMAVAVNINAKTDEFWDFAKVSYELVTLFLRHRNQFYKEAQSQQTVD